MSVFFKTLFASILLASVFTQHKYCDHLLGFGQANWPEASNFTEPKEEWTTKATLPGSDRSSNDPVYHWDEPLRDWVIASDILESQVHSTRYSSNSLPLSAPIEVDWRVLMDIRYKLRYFEELDMKIYSPVFSEAAEALDGKEVIIEGFVIPFDEEEESLSLSFNSYASCFFCGKASPASVISMYLKNQGKRYKMDDFLKFRGTLYLNQDDPNEFYYILRDAREE